MEDEETQLKTTWQKLGALDKIKLDAHGNVIDGFHRQKVDPNWPTEKNENITDPVQLAMARLVINVARREVPVEEKTRRLKEIAELTGWSPKEIAENIGMTYSWVMKYLPDEYKDIEKAKVGKIGGELSGASRREAKEPIKPVWVPCAACPLGTINPREWRGYQLCPLCFEEAEKDPDRILRKLQPHSKPKSPKKIETKVYKPKETWTHRKARMQTPVSKFEEEFSILAQKRGLPSADTNRTICIRSTTPDRYYTLRKGNLAVYFDGPVHKGREDRDALIREQLRKRGVKVREIKYDQPSQQALDEALDVVELDLIELGWNPKEVK